MLEVKPILLIRGTGNDADATALNALGISTICDPFYSINSSNDPGEAKGLLKATQKALTPTWIIAASRNALHHWAKLVGNENLVNGFRNPHLAFAAVGESAKNLFRELGVTEVLLGEVMTSKSLLTTLLAGPTAKAIIPCGNLALDTIPKGLRSVGWIVETGIVYENKILKQPPASLAQIKAGSCSAILLRSPSAARALLHYLPELPTQSSREFSIICGGVTTADECESLGMKVDLLCEDLTPNKIARQIKNWIEQR